MKNHMKNNKKLLIGIGTVAAAGIVIICIGLAVRRGGKDSVVYRETAVEYGNLTVGITEEAAVEIGTLEQTFDLDISALVDSDTSSDNQTTGAMPFGGDMGGGAMGAGMMSFGSFDMTQRSQSQSLTVEQVNAAVGQEIKEGDALYTLTAESVEEIRDTLSEDIADTKSDYEALQVEQEASRTQARQGYDTYVTNGKYAQLIYEEELKAYQEAVEDAAEAVNDKQDTYNEKCLELTALSEELAQAQDFLKEAQAAVSENYAGRYENAYYYTVYLNTRDTAQKLADQLEEEFDDLSEEIEQLSVEIQTAVRTMNQSQRDYEQAKLDFGKTYDTDTYYANAASEWYGIQTQSLDNALSSAKNSYDMAVEKLAEFDSVVQDNRIVSEYSGVVTQVALSEGDTLSGGSSLLVMNDWESVTMDVALSEEDYNTIEKGRAVNIAFTAYPDAVYSGIITDVSDAEYDSSTGAVYYTVTVTVQGDVSGLYAGMTGDVTFVTNETKGSAMCPTGRLSGRV